jgi:hypothetical protein
MKSRMCLGVKEGPRPVFVGQLTRIVPIKPGLPTFGLGREDQKVVVSSFAMLEQGKLFALGRFD